MNDLIALYKQRLSLQNATFSRINHDDAMVADVYKIAQPDGTQLILKICSRQEDYLREVYFLKKFSDQLPVPRTIQTVQPEIGIHGAILMEFLPGRLLKITDFTDVLAYEMGSILGRIHLNRTAGYGDLTRPQTLSSDPRHHFTLKFEEGMSECGEHLPSALLEQTRRYYETHVHLLDSVDGPCIIHRDFRPGNVIVNDGPCIIHRDFRPGNVIVNDGEIRGVIDWSSGRASFAEDDFCPMEHGEWPDHPISKKAFLKGYASVRPVPNYDGIMPLLRLSRAIATIGFTVKRGTWAASNARPYQFNRKFLETFLSQIKN